MNGQEKSLLSRRFEQSRASVGLRRALRVVLATLAASGMADGRIAQSHAEAADGPSLSLKRDISAGKGGGLLFNGYITQGVDCYPGSQYNVVGAPTSQRAASMQVLPTLNYAREIGYRSNPTVFAGLDDFRRADGYMSIRHGWALREDDASDTYDLYHFNVLPDGTEYEPVTQKQYYMGNAQAKKLGSYSLAGLEVMGTQNYTDGLTNISLSAQFGIRPNFQPAVILGVQCAQYIPMSMIDK